MGKYSRDKGARFERIIARQWRDAMPGASIKRGFQSRGGHEVADLDVPYFWPELKCGAKPNIRAALAQAVRGAHGSNRAPVAVVHDDGQETTATMRWSDFLKMASLIRNEFMADSIDEPAIPSERAACAQRAPDTSATEGR